jgi:hypothetical protein
VLIVQDWAEIRRLRRSEGVDFVTDPLIHRSRRWFGFRGLAWDRFAADAVAQY